MRSLLQRYLASHFVWPFCVATVFFVTFLLVFQLFRVTKYVVNKGVAPSTMLELMSNIALSFLPIAIPLSALFATLFCLNRLSDDSEIIAMRSFGMSKFKLFSPFLYLGFVISLISFSLGNSIIPNAKKDFKMAVHKLSSKGVLAEIQAGQFFTQIPGLTLYTEETSQDRQTLKNIFINLSHGQSIISAKRGKLLKEGKDKWGSADLRLVLFEGNIIRFDELTGKTEKIFFEEYDFPVLNSSSVGKMNERIEMKSLPELHALRQLPDDHLKSFMSDKDITKLNLEFWNRFNTPLLCIVFVILGFGLGIRPARGKERNTGLICLSVLIVYYSLYFTGISLAKEEQIPSLLAVFLPSVIGLFISMHFYRKA